MWLACLAHLDLGYLLYTTFSHTERRPKFRAVIPLDSIVSRSTLRTLFLYFQSCVFGGQADRTIYDPSDFVFAPCHDGRIMQSSGNTVEAAYVAQFALDTANAEDRSWLEGRDEVHEPLAHSPEQQAALATRFDDWAVSAAVSINNPAVCNAEWLAEYGGFGRSHNTDIGSILARIWKRSGGALSRGEMDHLWDGVDALDGFYCARKYGGAVKADRIQRLMQAIHTELNAEQERHLRGKLLAERLRTLRAKNKNATS